MSWLSEYRAGAYAEVWSAIAAAGAAVRTDPGRWRAAKDVARETMRRARLNVEAIHSRLLSEGYQFSHPEIALIDPEPDGSTRLDQIEEEVGPIALSLRCWIEEVGSVNLIGTHPEWSYEYADPLVVESTAADIRAERDERAAAGWFDDEDGFPLPLAPDYLHKADTSGGAPYSMWIPEPGGDGAWLYDDFHTGTFVDYLRSAFSLAGFPGFATQDAPPIPETVSRLARMLRQV